MDEISALRREVVELRIENKRLAASQPRLCRMCGRCDPSGIFLRCAITGKAVAPDDYRSQATPKERR